MFLLVCVIFLREQVGRSYGGKKIGRVDENGFVYDRAYGGKKVGRVKESKSELKYILLRKSMLKESIR